MPAWSYTALTQFETCGLQHYLIKVSKLVKDPPSEAVQWGRAAHKALENRLDKSEALPEGLSWLEPVAQLLMGQHGRRIVEEKLAIDEAFNPCGWFDSRTWCRAAIDFGLIGEKKALFLDWKTGSRKPDLDQMKLFAAMGFIHYPFLEEIHTAYVWLKEKKIDTEKFDRLAVGDLWSGFLPRVKRLQLAHEQNQWTPKPSGLCGKWCPVTKAHCQFGR